MTPASMSQLGGVTEDLWGGLADGRNWPVRLAVLELLQWKQDVVREAGLLPALRNLLSSMVAELAVPEPAPLPGASEEQGSTAR